MTPALYRHTDRLPDGTTAYGCHTLARDGRAPVALGCAHATPREAIAHKTPAPSGAAQPDHSDSSRDGDPSGAALLRGAPTPPAGVIAGEREDRGAPHDPEPVPPAGSGSLAPTLGLL